MPVEGVSGYPLQWPAGWARSKSRHTSKYKIETFAKARDEVVRNLRLMGVDQRDMILSTSLPLRADGLPAADGAWSHEPGAAVYWCKRRRASKGWEFYDTKVIACDHWHKLKENMWAIAHALEALRELERCGASQILERAYAGFAALPPASPKPKPWREVLGLEGIRADVDARSRIDAAFRELARANHPDRGGTNERMVEINVAYEAALDELSR